MDTLQAVSLKKVKPVECTPSRLALPCHGTLSAGVSKNLNYTCKHNSVWETGSGQTGTTSFDM